MNQELDLWGDPVPPPVEKRGRPQHEVTDAKRLRVAVLRSLNYSNDEIAAALSISERTLRAKYLPELKSGFAQKRAHAMVKLWELAEKGNVAALKAFIRETQLSDLKAAPTLPKPPKAKPLGKKEQAVIDAHMPDATSSMGQLMARRGTMGGVH